MSARRDAVRSRLLPLLPWAQGLGMLLVLQFALFGLLTLGQAVPDRPIVENLVAAVEDGTYGPHGTIDRMGGPADTFTECVVAGTGLGASPEESAFSRAVRMPRLATCGGGPAQLRAISEGAVLTDNDYFKYWAGYTVITRPVLALTGLEGLRIVSGTLMLLALAGAFLAVRARTSTAVGLALVLPYVVGTNLLSTPSTSFSQSISIAFIFLSVILSALGAGRSPRTAYSGVALGAALFCFVDLLTTPAVPWAMSAFAVGAVTWFHRRELAPTLVAVVLSGLVWPVAFAVTWLARWVLAGAFLGFPATLEVVRRNVGIRTGGDHAGVSEAFGAGVRVNAVYWWQTVPTAGLVLTGCLLAAGVGLVLALRRGGPARWGAAAVLALPAVAVPVWYTVLSNHSQIHAFFVNRGVAAALAVVTAACLAAAVRPRTGSGAPQDTAERAGPAATPARHDPVSGLAPTPEES
ncbi:hypothetical protein [uncultured Kocuria sp.]|uniref:hypothetical protein n=1 Tax=uncultured Kocuria sp. TaxID=259305 RepID=UPI0026158516|nr:hypothetical protein [uncultured Kocuria sp.]